MTRPRATITNRARAERAFTALLSYAATTDTRPWPRCELKHDPKAVITDLLTDLRHYCDHRGFRFEALIARSRVHRNAERRTPTTTGERRAA